MAFPAGTSNVPALSIAPQAPALALSSRSIIIGAVSISLALLILLAGLLFWSIRRRRRQIKAITRDKAVAVDDIEAQLTASPIMQSVSDCALLFNSFSAPPTPSLASDTTSDVDSDLEEVVLVPFSLASPTRTSFATTAATDPKLADLFDATTRPFSFASTSSASSASDLAFDNTFASSCSAPAIVAILKDLDNEEVGSRLHRLSLLANIPCTHFADFVPPRYGSEKTSTPRPFLTGVDHPRVSPAAKATVVHGFF
ncbi:hypothetical protein EIP91_003378 [Steccherinum ochraceum]|uniref:Uncharacterized protein n=1 Tax=Steccherinum ochraceum TaxID=92696 RepID=A0A4R0RGX3_9APHY|nr:hypothetical protein EIP91_003378 [Steccherinum ochraceum]